MEPFQLAVRNGRLEVVQIVALSSKELAYMAAMRPVTWRTTSRRSRGAWPPRT